MSRLFFALVPDQKTTKAFNRAVLELKHTKNEKVVEEEKLHLTLRYIGSIKEEVMNSLLNSVNKLKKATFALHISEQEFWIKPEITVLVPDMIPDALSDLVEELENICIDNGLPKECRKFKPHITVIKHSERHGMNKTFAKISWKVSNFVLLSSEVIDEKIRYTEIARWYLQE